MIELTFSLPAFVQACKKSGYIFESLMTRLTAPIFEHATNQFIPFVHSSDRVNFRVISYAWPHPFLTTPIPKFSVLLTCMRLYQHAKNQLILDMQ